MSRAKFDNDPVRLADDPYLKPYLPVLAERAARAGALERRLTGGKCPLRDFAIGHLYYGLHRTREGWVFREWAPNASEMFLVGDFSGWQVRPEWACRRIDKQGNWEFRAPHDALRHGMHGKLFLRWPGGEGDRLPAYARYVVQDPATNIFTAKIWAPDKPYTFRHAAPPPPDKLLIYEAHVGMAQEEPKVGTFREFREKTLPMIARSGYNTIQLMAVMSHPYYGSFGYHVANFFSISGRFGTPDEFKELVDAAHGAGLRVIMDVVHSHAVRNEVEGLGNFDGTRTAYFHAGSRGVHPAWDSYCFDYGKDQVRHFLLSNCRFWLDEYQLDGFRFDGVTSMLYRHHGLYRVFNGYEDYFNQEVDDDALSYLALANKVIHTVRPDATTVAEDVSGMPGLAAPVGDGGCGFDYRMAMGVTDLWFKLFDRPDEAWDMGGLAWELTNRRRDERTVSYVECHDQAIVGGQTAIFRLAGNAMYDAMHRNSASPAADRATALHKMIRLATAATAGHGYLNFMGNEFGHPEWIDFPREGNGWSYDHARRQWHLADDPGLRYGALREFDRAMMKVIGDAPHLYRYAPRILIADSMAKILVVARGPWLFCFNFHPDRSFTDYEISAPRGSYVTRLDSDAAVYDGFARVDDSVVHRAFTRGGRSMIRIYLPCRTALALQRTCSITISGSIS